VQINSRLFNNTMVTPYAILHHMW